MTTIISCEWLIKVYIIILVARLTKKVNIFSNVSASVQRKNIYSNLTG